MPYTNYFKFTGTGNAKQPVSVCRDMWNIYLPTGGGYLFTKKDITLVDTEIDLNLVPGNQIEVMSEGIIAGTASCAATSFMVAGTVGPYRITIPVININSSSDETGTAGALIATVKLTNTYRTKYEYNGTF